MLSAESGGRFPGRMLEHPAEIGAVGEASAFGDLFQAQGCNAVGWILGPIIGSSFVLSKTETVNTSNASLYLPYLIVAGVPWLMS